MLGIGNAGFRLELIGYGIRETVLLKMSDLPFVWIFINRPPDGPYLDPSFEFSTTSESSLVKKTGGRALRSEGRCDVVRPNNAALLQSIQKNIRQNASSTDKNKLHHRK